MNLPPVSYTHLEVLSVEAGKIVTVNEETIIEYVQEVWQKGKQKGFIENYRFLLSRNDTEIRIIFFDCGRSLNTLDVYKRQIPREYLTKKQGQSSQKKY